MMSEARVTAKKVCGVMVAEHAITPGNFRSGEVHKYRFMNTVWAEQHHKDILSQHRQQS